MINPQPLPPVRPRHSGAATEAPAARVTTPILGKRLMARVRTIKPGFFLNERLAELPPLTRILFAGLWCNADRLGRLEDRPKKIKAAILPYDDHDVNLALQQLHESGFIVRYKNCEASYIQVVAFCKHQHPHLKELESEIPGPDLGTSLTVPRHDSARQDLLDPGSTVSTGSTELTRNYKKHNSLLCTELCENGSHTSMPKSGRVMLKTCKKGEEWEVPAAKITEWEESYPDVDVMMTLYGIRQWLNDNPAKRKTSRGMVRFIGAWMMREQDKP
jgi:hypothetical protein